ncbi:MAG: hypothetical protein A3I63_11475 [Betaproteobacteria bacterium RIFCSPLOWO2_02_FULL_66_14]|nr:MAG: hypothetical protein A3I63_11475 [Betaproteobacteria bacterium RIFCSPLOWO2_02_FULL_66_14]
MRFAGAGLLGELFACGGYRHRDVEVARLRESQEPLQEDLPRGRVEQIRSAHDIRHALIGVVHHHRELVGEQAIGPTKNEITNLAGDRLRNLSLHAIGEYDRFGFRPKAHRARRAARCETLAAGARVDARAID